jgi:hypothetical protein
MEVFVKLAFEDESKVVIKAPANYSELLKAIRGRKKDSENSLKIDITYKDDDGDIISVSNDIDYEGAVGQIQSGKKFVLQVVETKPEALERSFSELGTHNYYTKDEVNELISKMKSENEDLIEKRLAAIEKLLVLHLEEKFQTLRSEVKVPEQKRLEVPVKEEEPVIIEEPVELPEKRHIYIEETKEQYIPVIEYSGDYFREVPEELPIDLTKESLAVEPRKKSEKSLNESIKNTWNSLKKGFEKMIDGDQPKKRQPEKGPVSAPVEVPDVPALTEDQKVTMLTEMFEIDRETVSKYVAERPQYDFEDLVEGLLAKKGGTEASQ